MFGQKISHIIGLSLIVSLSLVTIWSTTPSLFFSQLAFLLVGLLFLLSVKNTDPIIWQSVSKIGYIVSIALLIITHFFAPETRGSSRWISLGLFDFQASEFIKPVLAVYFADYLSRHDTRQMKYLFQYLGLVILPAAIVFLQPDLGSSLVLLFFGFFMLLVNGINPKVLLFLSVFGLVFGSVALKLAKPYQLERLTSFVNPYADPKGSGYHVIQSIIAVGSGGIFGKGVRLGTQSHLNFLPERHTDFIFASFVEEFGLLGLVILISSYFVFLNSLLGAALRTRNRFSFLLLLGIFATFIFQMTVNVGMNLGLMPITGITLPLFSYGGNSLISFLIMVGISLKLLDLSPPKPL